MIDDDTFLISQHPEKQKSEDIRETNKMKLIQLSVSYGLEPMSIFGNQNSVKVTFEADRFDEFQKQYIGERSILLSSRMSTYSQDWWRNLMVVWKSKQRYIKRTKFPDIQHLHPRFHIWDNPLKPIPQGTITRDIDREDLFNLIYSSGIEPVFAEGDRRNTVWTHFLDTELQAFEDQYFSNLEVLYPLGRYIRSSELWSALMGLCSDQLKQNGG
jgi:hypothetical protein